MFLGRFMVVVIFVVSIDVIIFNLIRIIYVFYYIHRFNKRWLINAWCYVWTHFVLIQVIFIVGFFIGFWIVSSFVIAVINIIIYHFSTIYIYPMMLLLFYYLFFYSIPFIYLNLTFNLNNIRSIRINKLMRITTIYWLG